MTVNGFTVEENYSTVLYTYFPITDFSQYPIVHIKVKYRSNDQTCLQCLEAINNHSRV